MQIATKFFMSVSFSRTAALLVLLDPCSIEHAEGFAERDAGQDHALLRLIVANDALSAPVVPIRVEIWPGSTTFVSAACVALQGEPGVVVVPFPDGCSAIDAGSADAGNADAGDVDADAGTAEFPGARICVDISSPARTHSVIGYRKSSRETHASLFAALYASADCTGPVVASTALTLSFGDHQNDGGAADASAADGSAETPEDGGEDATVEDGSILDSSMPDGSISDASTSDGEMP